MNAPLETVTRAKHGVNGIMHDNNKSTPVADSTAVRVALCRALHVRVDPPPHVLEDGVGLRLAAPEEGWLSPP